MYIGPWQEFKLARIIQEQTAASQPTPTLDQRGRALSSLALRSRSNAPRPRSSRFSDPGGDSYSSAGISGTTTPGSVSGFSTQSAPAAPPSAQARLNDYCGQTRREERFGASKTRNLQPGSARSLPPRRTPAAPPGKAKAKAKAKQKSIDEWRRDHLKQMQKLYGLAKDDPPENGTDAGHAASPEPRCSPTPESSSRGSWRLGEAPAADLQVPAPTHAPRNTTLDSSRWLAEMPMPVSAMPPPIPGPGMFKDNDVESNRFGGNPSSSILPALPEDSVAKDPLGMSMGSLSMASSGGMIAWSKNLQPDDISPHATLVNLLMN